MSLDIKQIAQLLAERAEDVCRWLLPNGKRNGNEWEVGSIDGEVGRSLKVNLVGKAGLWRDFASDCGGDLIDLILHTQGVNKGEAVKAAKDFLGLRDTPPQFEPKQRQYKSPQRTASLCSANAPTIDFFQKRGIGTETVTAFKIGTLKGHENGDVIAFPYYHEKKVVFIKYRPIANKKGMFTSKDSLPCLFGMHLMPENARSLTICEGEIDAMSFYEAGYYAVSVPRGGGDGAKQDDWIATHFDELQLFDTVYLALDNDEQGRKAAAHIALRLGGHRCFWLDFGPHKDANEYLLAGGDFSTLFANAQTRDPQELKHATAYTEDIINYFAEGGPSMRGMPLPWSKTSDKVRLRLGECSVWGGRNGQGKSQVLGHIMAHSIGQGAAWCIASMEFTPVTLLARMYRQIAATPSPSPDLCRGHLLDYVQGNLFLFDVRGKAKGKRILEVFNYARQRYGCTQFLIDSLAKCGFGEDDYNGQKAFVDEISDFSLTHNVHIHLVAHARKGEREDAPPDKLDVKGTSGITDLVDNVFMIWRNKPKEQKLAKEQSYNKRAIIEASEPCSIVTCCKQRHGDWEGAILLWFDRASLQYLEEPEFTPKPIYQTKNNAIFAA